MNALKLSDNLYPQFSNKPRLNPGSIFWFVAGVIILLFIFMLATHQLCHAEITPPEDLWKGIIAEAVSEGYIGMYAVACCYKNRIEQGLPLGCVALKRKDLNNFVKNQGVKYEIMAKNILDKVFYQNGYDVTLGATHYENIERYGYPYWAKEMLVTVKIGQHTFYKEAK
ncbi:MAG: hypothetical protein DRP74_02145 [Candidatus Omnitrophota bacterium]|nr:MAG: hypothetical protein DRP74_02145 [Candidatus Omnitrophota bacterium]